MCFVRFRSYEEILRYLSRNCTLYHGIMSTVLTSVARLVLQYTQQIDEALRMNGEKSSRLHSSPRVDRAFELHLICCVSRFKLSKPFDWDRLERHSRVSSVVFT